MVAIGLSAGSVARVRFAVSALWEVAAGVRVLRAPGAHAVHLPWVRRVRPRLDAAGLDGWLLWQLVPARPGYFADFLTPPADGLVPCLDTELDTLRATPPPTVRADLAAYPRPLSGPLADLYADPATGLARLAREIEAYWRLAVAPDWPRIRVLLDGEVYDRARLLATDGVGGLLNDLHERLSWADDRLSIAARACTAPDVLDGGGIVLVPSVFVWPDVLSIATARTPQVAYPARRIATLWESAPARDGALGDLIGRTRAHLLTAMASPKTTGDLARECGLTPGGVSQHLAVLRAAGLVTAHRHGRSVVNARTPVAAALLDGG
jgi:DNA-binding transcriptional ArsR family regulator